MALKGILVEKDELTREDRDEMFLLMSRHYVGMDPTTFESDLDEKRWVIQVRLPSGQLVGFSTQMLLDVQIDGRPVKALFSGDTIVDQRHWGDRAIVQSGARLALSLVEQVTNVDLYWFLIAGGYKTYRFLPLLCREFYPRFDQSTPADIQRVINELAELKFPRHYSRLTGVIESDATQYSLRDGVADVTNERLLDPHVRYFVAQNPGHVRGDELCCLAKLSLENFTDAAYRVMGLRR